MGAEAQERAPAEKLVLRYGWVGEPDSLNPFIAVSARAYMIFRLNYNQLVGYDKNLEPAPELAEAWERNEDGTMWTFRLRRDVKWHDGRPFTAADVKFTFEYIINGGLDMYKNYTGQMLTPIETPDEYTVVIRFKAPQAWMPALNVPILPKHVWEKIPPEQAKTTFENAPPIIGTGPFQVVEFKKKEHVRLVANKSYWGGAPNIDEVIFINFANDDTMIQALKAGEIDVVGSVPTAQFQSLQSLPGIATVNAPGNGYWEVAYNNWQDRSKSKGHPALLDRTVRVALDYAIDRQKIVDVALFGLAQPGSSALPPYLSYWHWEPPPGVKRPFDLEQAKRLLDEAGYKDVDGDGIRETPDGKGKLDFRFFILSTHPESPKIADLIKDWWKQIGVNVTVSAMDDGTLQDKILAGDYDVFIWGWGGDQDPSFLLSIFTTDQIGSWSDSYYSNPEYDRLYEQQKSTIDREKRREIIYKMQEIIYNDVPYSILYYWSTLQAYRTDRFEGWQPLANGAVVSSYNIDTFLKLTPAGTKQAAGSGSRSPAKVLVPVVVLAAAVVLWRLLRRRPTQAA